MWWYLQGEAQIKGLRGKKKSFSFPCQSHWHIHLPSASSSTQLLPLLHPCVSMWTQLLQSSNADWRSRAPRKIFSALITTLELWGIQSRGESSYRDPNLSSLKTVTVSLSGLDHLSQASLLLIYSSFHFSSLEAQHNSERTRAGAT